VVRWKGKPSSGYLFELNSLVREALIQSGNEQSYKKMMEQIKGVKTPAESIAVMEKYVRFSG